MKNSNEKWYPDFCWCRLRAQACTGGAACRYSDSVPTKELGPVTWLKELDDLELDSKRKHGCRRDQWQCSCLPGHSWFPLPILDFKDICMLRGVEGDLNLPLWGLQSKSVIPVPYYFVDRSTWLGHSHFWRQLTEQQEQWGELVESSPFDPQHIVLQVENSL